MKVFVLAVSVLVAVALAAASAFAGAPANAAPKAAPKKPGGVMIMEADMIKGTRQAPRVYYVLEPAKVEWKGAVPSRSFLPDVEGSVLRGAGPF